MTTRADSLAQQISALTERLHAAEESIKTLNSSISELVTSKKEHEDLLMANFVHVLNEKKLKIRNQQRLLAAAKVDEDKSMLFCFPIITNWFFNVLNSLGAETSF